MTQVKDTNLALMADKELHYELDGDILFATPEPKRKPVRTVAIGVINAGSKAEIIADADQFNGGVESVVMLPEFSAVYVLGNELEMMAADLDILRAGKVTPLIQSTSEQLDEVDKERIGTHFSENPYQY